MTFKQWLIHIISWLLCFPFKGDNSHLYAGKAPRKDKPSTLTCMICDKETIEELED
jgi:hypothetical protein